MSSKPWVIAVAAALGCLQALPSSFVSATIFGEWHPVGTQGGFQVCTNASKCGDNTLGFSLLRIDEFSADQNSIPRAVSGLNNTQVFLFGDNSPGNWGDGSTSVTKRLSAAVPNNGIDVPYALPAINGDPIFVCEVTQLVSGGRASFGSTAHFYDAPFARGALQVDFDVNHWAFANLADSLNMSMLITLNENAQMTGQMISSALYSPKIMRYNLTKTVYLDLPLVALDEYGTEVSARVDLVGTDGIYYLHVGMPARLRLRYTFLISGGGNIVVPAPVPTSIGTNTPTITNGTNTNTTLPPTTLPTTASQSKTNAFPTTLNTLPGGFEFCVAPNCNIFDGSFSLTLDRMSSDIFLNRNDSNPTFGSVTTDFSSSIKELVFETLNSRSNTSSIGNNSSSDFQALLLSVPIEGGLAKRVAMAEFNDMNDSDVAYLGLLLEHLAAPSVIDEGYGSGTIMAKGAVKMSLLVSLPGFDSAGMPSNNMTNLAISFFISAFQYGKMVTNVTVDRKAYHSTRVILGDDMYLEFPYYTMVDDYSYPIEVNAKLHTSGESQGLIQLSLLVSSTISYSFGCEAMISSATVDNGTSRATEWSPRLPPTKVNNRDIKAQILTLSHGEFGLCFNTSSCDSSSVKMGFSGLGVMSSTSGGGVVTTEFNKFRNAAGFQFREPELVVEGDVTKWSTGFSAFVPQSPTLPPFPYDASLVSTTTYPAFSVQVDQFLTHGQALNGNQKIKVPRGALKFAINITKWTFASVTDTLVLNITLNDVIGDDGSNNAGGVPGALGFNQTVDNAKHISRTLFDDATLVEFPLLAVVDGQMKAVGVTPSFDASNGLTFTLVFPYFAHTLYYDPVLSSLALEADQARDEDNKTLVDVNLRSHGPKSTKSDTIAIILLVFLVFVLIVSAARCMKRVSINLDFSKLVV